MDWQGSRTTRWPCRSALEGACSDATIAVPEYYILAGFPTKNSSWDTTSCKTPSLQVKYHVPDQDTQVSFGNTLVEIHTLIEERRKTDPRNAKVLWHKIIQKPATGRPGGFVLEPQGNVWFTLPQHLTFQARGVKDEAGTNNVPLTQGITGAAIGFDVWAKASHVKLAWTVKWRQAGLQPGHPKLVCPLGFSILPKQAVKVL